MKRLLLTLAVLALVLPAASASAATIDLDSNYLIGTVIPGSPSNGGEEAARLNNIIDWYNDGFSGTKTLTEGNKSWDYWVTSVDILPGEDLPSPAVYAAPQALAGWTLTDDTYYFTIPAAYVYDYVSAKFGDKTAYYYIGGIAGGDTIGITAPFVTNGLGLSHLTFYNKSGNEVPEPASMLLLGTGLFGLAGAARRRFRR